MARSEEEARPHPGLIRQCSLISERCLPGREQRQRDGCATIAETLAWILPTRKQASGEQLSSDLDPGVLVRPVL